MEIKKIKDVHDWNKKRGIHYPVFEAIKAMKIGEVLEINLDSPSIGLGCLLQQYFRRNRNFGFSVKSKRLDRSALKWVVKKFELEDSK